MIKSLGNIAKSCDLLCHDTHASGVPGLHKPDAVLTLAHRSRADFMINADAVAFIAEFKARVELNAAVLRVFEFPPDEMGQVLDKLRRLRHIRNHDELFAMLSNGFHYQLFKLDVEGVLHVTKVLTMSDVGPLKAAMNFAKQSLTNTLWFVEELRKRDEFKSMDVRALLGAGAHCRAWKCGDETRSITVVVAETADTSCHLIHNYDVFTALMSGRGDTVLYTPLWRWTNEDKSKAVAVFEQVGERWTASMYREMKLTRQDVLDIADQIKHFHANGYIHGDVALRNFVRYEKSKKSKKSGSVLIDAGAAVKKNEHWRGGTVNNASLAWLETNLDKLDALDHANVTVPSKQDELWSFVFAVMDLCFPKPSDRREIIEYRKKQIQYPALVAIGALVDALDYEMVAIAVADMLLCLPTPSDGKTTKWSSPKGYPEHPRTLHATTPPASPAPAAQTRVKRTRRIKKKDKKKL